MVTFNFSGKIVLVTGGTSGLGLATVHAFANAGAEIVVASRHKHKAQQAFENLKGKVHFIPTDLGKTADVNNLFEEIETTFNRLDIAINNATGEHGVGKSLTEFTEEEFDATFNVNLKALWLSMKYEIRLMQRTPQKTCHIINVSSVNGLGGVEYGSLYAASKAGVIALTKSAALELAKTNISVNVIVPGAFDTALLQRVMAMQSGDDPEKAKTVRQQYEQFIPTGKIGNPDDFAKTVLWLSSGNNPSLCGHSIILDGGITARYR